MFVKICATTSEDDALLAVAMGADAVGFVFAPSTRQIAPQIAADIVKRLPPEIVTIGVFRNEVPERVVRITQRAGLRGAQLHGHEPADEVQWIRARLQMVIKGFTAGDARVAQAAEYRADAILLDAPNPGSGQVFDWAFASEVPTGQRLMIAGGLHAGNVAAAIERTHPWGVDVATGVESEPGHKDAVKLRNFIAAVRAVPSDVYQGPDDMPYDWQEDS